MTTDFHLISYSIILCLWTFSTVLYSCYQDNTYDSVIIVYLIIDRTTNCPTLLLLSLWNSEIEIFAIAMTFFYHITTLVSNVI